MKNLLTKFSENTLSKEQMKSVKGGMCRILFDTVDGGCGSISVTYGAGQEAAVNYAESKMGGSINGSSTINGYSMRCDEM